MRNAVACLFAVLVVSAQPLAAQSATDCDRTCLTAVMTAYLDSLVAHDASKAPLAASTNDTPMMAS